MRHLSPYFYALSSSLNELGARHHQNLRIVKSPPAPATQLILSLEKVDVIICRIDDVYCDPLELKEDSQLGVTGLLQVIRSGNVSIANPPGSSI